MWSSLLNCQYLLAVASAPYNAMARISNPPWGNLMIAATRSLDALILFAFCASAARAERGHLTGRFVYDGQPPARQRIVPNRPLVGGPPVLLFEEEMKSF